MTNLELIQTADAVDIAKFLHAMQAGALIEFRADSVETLLDWLLEEEDASEDAKSDIEEP